jgi:hypothetical protein
VSLGEAEELYRRDQAELHEWVTRLHVSIDILGGRERGPARKGALGGGEP